MRFVRLTKVAPSYTLYGPAPSVHQALVHVAAIKHTRQAFFVIFMESAIDDLLWRHQVQFDYGPLVTPLVLFANGELTKQTPIVALTWSADECDFLSKCGIVEDACFVVIARFAMHHLLQCIRRGPMSPESEQARQLRLMSERACTGRTLSFASDEKRRKLQYQPQDGDYVAVTPAGVKVLLAFIFTNIKQVTPVLRLFHFARVPKNSFQWFKRLPSISNPFRDALVRVSSPTHTEGIDRFQSTLDVKSSTIQLDGHGGVAPCEMLYNAFPELLIIDLYEIVCGVLPTSQHLNVQHILNYESDTLRNWVTDHRTSVTSTDLAVKAIRKLASNCHQSASKLLWRTCCHSIDFTECRRCPRPTSAPLSSYVQDEKNTAMNESCGDDAEAKIWYDELCQESKVRELSSDKQARIFACNPVRRKCFKALQMASDRSLTSDPPMPPHVVRALHQFSRHISNRAFYRFRRTFPMHEDGMLCYYAFMDMSSVLKSVDTFEDGQAKLHA